jgi:hypothetical protein
MKEFGKRLKSNSTNTLDVKAFVDVDEAWHFGIPMAGAQILLHFSSPQIMIVIM